MPARAESIRAHVGRPLPRILRVNTNILPKFWAEFCLKYRIVLYVVIGYENEARNIKLWPAEHILTRGIEEGMHIGKTKIGDSTSGNFGKGIAVALKRRRRLDPQFSIMGVVSVVPRSLEKAKIQALEAEGIELFYADDSMHAMELMAQLAEEHGWWYTRQYWNDHNTQAYWPIAEETARVLPTLGVAGGGIGSGGFVSGWIGKLRELFAERELPFHAIGTLVDIGHKIGGMRSEPATQKGTLRWREVIDDSRFVGEKPARVFSSSLWEQRRHSSDGDACFGGESTGCIGEGLMLGLYNLALRKQLDRFRAPDGNVYACFVSPDTREPYRANYEKHGIFLSEDEWKLPILGCQQQGALDLKAPWANR